MILTSRLRRLKVAGQTTSLRCHLLVFGLTIAATLPLAAQDREPAAPATRPSLDDVTVPSQDGASADPPTASTQGPRSDASTRGPNRDRGPATGAGTSDLRDHQSIAAPELPASAAAPANRDGGLLVPPSLMQTRDPQHSEPESADIRVPGPMRKLLKDALRGDGKAVRSGHALFDGLLDVAGEVGSVLDEYPLEHEALLPHRTVRSASGRSSESERARAAESLLKAARKLERLRPAEATRAALITEMRASAGRLLSE